MSNILTLTQNQLPERLQQIPQPPLELFVQGAPLAALLTRPTVAIVGTRRVTAYGRQVTRDLSKSLAERGIVIISGLALGVDAIAHQAALEAGGTTIAVLPSSLSKLVPATNRYLAQRIIDSGGALVSEYSDSAETYKHNFIARNRIVTGLSDGVLVTEASEKSGTHHTIGFAHDQGRSVMVVPGNITSPQSKGTNSQLRTAAHPILSYRDVLHVLDIADMTTQQRVRGSNRNEQLLLDLMQSDTTDGALLLQNSSLEVNTYNHTLTMLEITGKIRPLGGNHWSIC